MMEKFHFIKILSFPFLLPIKMFYPLQVKNSFPTLIAFRKAKFFLALLSVFLQIIFF